MSKVKLNLEPNNKSCLPAVVMLNLFQHLINVAIKIPLNRWTLILK
jgi:hypothetical protein